MDDRFTISHQPAFVPKQASSLLDRIWKSTGRRLREVILPLCSSLVGHIWSIMSNSEFASLRQTWAYWSRSGDMKGRHGRTGIYPREKKAQWDHTNVYKHLMGGCKKDAFQRYPVMRSEGMGIN